MDHKKIFGAPEIWYEQHSFRMNSKNCSFITIENMILVCDRNTAYWCVLYNIFSFYP